MNAALKQIGAQFGALLVALFAAQLTVPYMIGMLMNAAIQGNLPDVPDIFYTAFVLGPAMVIGTLSGWGLARLAHAKE